MPHWSAPTFLEREQQRREARRGVLARSATSRVRTPRRSRYRPGRERRHRREYLAAAQDLWLAETRNQQGETFTAATTVGSYVAWFRAQFDRRQYTVRDHSWHAPVTPVGDFYYPTISPEVYPTTATTTTVNTWVSTAAPQIAAAAAYDELTDTCLDRLYERLAEDLYREVLQMTDSAWRRWTVRVDRVDFIERTITAVATPRSIETTDEVWDGWAEGTQSTTAELRRQQVREARRQNIRASRLRSSELRRRVANRRAEALLREHLDDEQRACLDEYDYFRIVTAGGHVFDITRGHSGNVYSVADGRRAVSYCAHGREYMPDADHMLLQKLWLETDEGGFLRVANPSGAYGTPNLAPQHRTDDGTRVAVHGVEVADPRPGVSVQICRAA